VTSSARVEPDEFEQVASYVQRCGFFEWADEYQPSEFVTDNPEYRIRVVKDGLVKEVLQYATNEPPGFGRLAARIDQVAERILWARDEPDVGATEA